MAEQKLGILYQHVHHARLYLACTFALYFSTSVISLSVNVLLQEIVVDARVIHTFTPNSHGVITQLPQLLVDALAIKCLLLDRVLQQSIIIRHQNDNNELGSSFLWRSLRGLSFQGNFVKEGFTRRIIDQP
ncbi:hypothetical protein E4T56_gene19304 [Termitomyces sp. T112]|nr:hypothetical protein E4T56_gene19304 [Termitomyces sp. T112]